MHYTGIMVKKQPSMVIEILVPCACRAVQAKMEKYTAIMTERKEGERGHFGQNPLREGRDDGLRRPQPHFQQAHPRDTAENLADLAEWEREQQTRISERSTIGTRPREN